MPYLSQTILLGLEQGDFEREMGMRLEAVFHSKVSIKAVLPDSGAPIRAKRAR
jgi:hypothetical protein